MRIGLPALSGRTGTIVLVLYRILAALTAVYVALDLPLESVDLFRNSPALSHYGFAVERGARGALPVSALYPSAARAGLAVGDRVIAAGDTRLPPRATRFDLGAKLAAQPTAPARLVVADPAGHVRALLLPPQKGALGLVHLFYGMPIWAFGIIQLLSLGIPLAVLLAASFLLYRRRPRDGEAMLLAFSFLALVFSTSAGSWPFLYLGVPATASEIAVQVGTALLCLAVAGVPDGRFPSVWARLALVAALVYGVVGVWAAIGRGDPSTVETARWLPEYAAILLAVVALMMRYRASVALERQQIKWVLIGAVVTLVALLIPIGLHYGGADAVLPPWAQHVVRLAVFAIFHIAIPVGMVISVLAYRLYDSDAAITRSAAFAALSIAVIGVFAASESVVGTFGQKIVSSELGSFSGALAAAFTAMMIGPMHARIKRAAERGFRRDLFEMREGVPPLVGDLRETTPLAQVADAVVARVWNGVRPIAAAILLGDSIVVTRGIDSAGVADWRGRWVPPAGTALSCDKADRTFPTRVPLAADGIGRVGWLLLGPRPDGSLYGKDERKALTEIADPVARALAIAATREARSALHEDNNRALRARLDEVEAKLARLLTRDERASDG